MSDNVVILLAGGRGTRMRRQEEDKVMAPLVNGPVLSYSLRAFLKSGVVDSFVFVCREEVQRERIASLVKETNLAKEKVIFVFGGERRQDSVWNGLSVLSQSVRYVFIHDGARPLVTPSQIQNLYKAVVLNRSVVLAHRVTDSIRRATLVNGAGMFEDIERENLWAMETPQVFERENIVAAYWNVQNKGLTVTDDVAAVSLLGQKVTIVENTQANPKITTPEDLQYVRTLLM